MLRDRTDMRMQLERQSNRVQRLEDEVAALRKAVATLGHEIRTPLSAAMNAAIVLESLVTDPKGLRALQILKRQQQVIRRIADDALDATRADLGRRVVSRLELDAVDLKEVLDDTVRTLGPLFQSKRVGLTDLVSATSIEVLATVDGCSRSCRTCWTTP